MQEYRINWENEVYWIRKRGPDHDEFLKALHEALVSAPEERTFDTVYRLILLVSTDGLGTVHSGQWTVANPIDVPARRSPECERLWEFTDRRHNLDSNAETNMLRITQQGQTAIEFIELRTFRLEDSDPLASFISRTNYVRSLSRRSLGKLSSQISVHLHKGSPQLWIPTIVELDIASRAFSLLHRMLQDWRPLLRSLLDDCYNPMKGPKSFSYVSSQRTDSPSPACDDFLFIARFISQLVTLQFDIALYQHPPPRYGLPSGSNRHVWGRGKAPARFRSDFAAEHLHVLIPRGENEPASRVVSCQRCTLVFTKTLIHAEAIITEDMGLETEKHGEEARSDGTRCSYRQYACTDLSQIMLQRECMCESAKKHETRRSVIEPLFTSQGPPSDLALSMLLLAAPKPIIEPSSKLFRLSMELQDMILTFVAASTHPLLAKRLGCTLGIGSDTRWRHQQTELIGKCVENSLGHRAILPDGALQVKLAKEAFSGLYYVPKSSDGQQAMHQIDQYGNLVEPYND